MKAETESPAARKRCPGCGDCYAREWHAATVWRLYPAEMIAHVARLGIDRVTTGEVS